LLQMDFRKYSSYSFPQTSLKNNRDNFIRLTEDGTDFDKTRIRQASEKPQRRLIDKAKSVKKAKLISREKLASYLFTHLSIENGFISYFIQSFSLEKLFI